MYALAFYLREIFPISVELGFYLVLFVWFMLALYEDRAWRAVGTGLLCLGAVLEVTRLPTVEWSQVSNSIVFSQALGDQLFRAGMVGVTTSCCAIAGTWLGQRGEPLADSALQFLGRNLMRVVGLALLLSTSLFVPILLEAAVAQQMVRQSQSDQAQMRNAVLANSIALRLAEMRSQMTDCCVTAVFRTKASTCNGRINRFNEMLTQFGLASAQRPGAAEAFACRVPMSLPKQTDLARVIAGLPEATLQLLDRQVGNGPLRTTDQNSNTARKSPAIDTPPPSIRAAIEQRVMEVLSPHGWATLLERPINIQIFLLEMLGGLLLAWSRYASPKLPKHSQTRGTDHGHE